MKKIAPILLIALTYVLYAQDFDPKQQKFMIMDSSVYVNSQHPLFKLRGFMLGVQWGAHFKKISSALEIKQKDGKPEVPDDVQDSCDIFYALPGQSHNMGEDLYNARAMVYEPTLIIDSLNPTKLVKRQGDTTKPVFGFMYHKGEIPINPTDPNFNRLILRDSLSGQLVLSKPWPDNELNMLGFYHHTDTTAAQYAILDSFLCRKLYLSINLKALDNQFPTDTILKIEVPYTLNTGVTGLINFSRIPSVHPDSLAQFPLNRGYFRKTDTVRSFNRAIFITRNMLLQNDSNITISAVFNLKKDDRQLYLSNYYLRNDVTKNDVVTNLGINVTYVGRTAVAIDWIKFETPHARAFLSGEFDNKIIHDVDSAIKSYSGPEWTARGIRPFRFELVVESGIAQWASQRYFHKLIGDVTTKEEGAMLPCHYDYYVNPADRWIDVGASRGAHIANPYCRKYYVSYDNICRTMRLGSGYMGMVGVNPLYIDSLQDTLYQRYEVKNDYKTANYETMVPIYEHNLLKPTYFLNHPEDMGSYRRAMNDQGNGYGGSPMMWLERIGYGTYNNKIHSGFLYSEKPWWAHFFIMTAYFDVSINEPPLNLIRQKTLAFDVITSFFTP